MIEHRIGKLFTFVLVLAALAPSAHAALNAYAELRLSGTALDGDVTLNQIGGIDVSLNHIEVYEFSQKQEISSKNGKVVVSPLILLKRQDSVSPALIQGLMAADIIEGKIKFFGNDPETGETRLESTIEIIGGRLVSFETQLPNAFDPSASNRPTLEIIKIQAGSLIYTNEVNSSGTAWSGT